MSPSTTTSPLLQLFAESKKNSPPKWTQTGDFTAASSSRALQFHPSGRYLAIGTHKGDLILNKSSSFSQSREEWHKVTEFRDRHSSAITCVAFNITGNLFASSSNDKIVRLNSFREETGQLGREHVLRMHDGAVRDLAFLEDTANRSNLLVSASDDSKILVTDCSSGLTFKVLQAHKGAVTGLCTWGGCMLASRFADRSIRLWDLRRSDPIFTITSDNFPMLRTMKTFDVGLNGRLMAIGDEEGKLSLMDLSTQKILNQAAVHKSAIGCMQFHPDQRFLLTGGADRSVFITDARDPVRLTTKHAIDASDKVLRLSWHPEKTAFAYSSMDTLIRIVHLHSAPESNGEHA